MSQKQVVTRPGGTPKHVHDAALNDSDKSYTVPTGKVWAHINIGAQLTCTATVGNRNLAVTLSNGTDILWASTVGTNTTANNVGHLVVNSLGTYGITGANLKNLLPDPASGSGNTSIIDGLFPDVPLPAGYVIRIYDKNAIDAAADDLRVYLSYVEYEA